MKKHLLRFFPFLGLIGLLQVAHSAGPRRQAMLPGTQSSAPFPATARSQLPGVLADRDFGRLPLYFIANRGQLDDRVTYYVQGRDKTLYFTPKGVTIALADGKNRLGDGTSPRVFHGKGAPFKNGNAGSLTREGNSGIKERLPAGRWVVKLNFVGANADVRPEGLENMGALVSYFKGRPDDWHTGLPTYSKITYRDLWPGIDLVYSGTFDRLKYEFIVHPGADPSQIRLAYRGIESLDVTEEGRLRVATGAGSFEDDIPLAWQEIDGKNVAVSCGFALLEKGDSGDRRSESLAPYAAKEPQPNDQIDAEGDELTAEHPWSYGFRVGEYDRTRDLVLDPVILVYCGYIGGSADDFVEGIDVDGSGNVYVAGYTHSNEISFPVAAGPDTTFNGGTIDAFVAKVNASGTALIYCGYIGGSASDYGMDIDVDGSGNAFVTGYTYSNEASFPVIAGPDLNHNGAADVFVAKVNASGTGLVYCGYIGGSNGDYGRGIAVDSSGNAFVTGWTESSESNLFPVTVGPDITYNGSHEAFVAKLNAAGTALSYCGYIGGLSGDYGVDIGVDSSGNAYVAGYTYSNQSTFPVVVGPDLTHNGSTDVFVAKVNSTGTGLTYCGYIGGSAEDEARGIAVDGSGCAYLTGYTLSPESSFPVAVGPDLTHNGGVDTFVAKVASSGETLFYCGYIGGAGGDSGEGIAVDISGHACVVGSATSDEMTFPVLGGPVLTHNGSFDVFVARINPAGSSLRYCGYVGGTGVDFGRGIAVDESGNAYVTGETGSSAANFPVVVGPDLTPNGATETFVAKIFEEPIWKPRHAVGDFDGDGADEVAVDFGSAGIYLYDGGIWTQISSANPESLVAADVDGDTADEILADLGSAGLWLWNAGAWTMLSGVNAEGMAAGNVDADGADEVIGDFGMVGLWLYNGGSWTQLSGVNADEVFTVNVNDSPEEELVGDFGSSGLWIYDFVTMGGWYQMSGVNADHVTSGRLDGYPGGDVVGDFGALGLWMRNIVNWTQLSGGDADYVMAIEADGDAYDELVGDFGLLGMWFWNDGTWEQISGANAEFMIGADVNGDGSDDGVADFGSLGLWLGIYGSDWTQLSGVNPEYVMAGDLDGDGADEILVDFGSLGLWQWNGGSWSQISALNPD